MGIFDFIFQRRNDMSQWAAEMQMTFFENDQYGLMQQIEAFDLMSSGHSRRIKNIMVHGHEMDDVQECIFDYHYDSGSGDNKSTHKTSVIFLNSKSLLLPTFYMRPKNKLGKWFQRIRNKNQGPGDQDQLLYNYKVKMDDASQLDFLINSGIHTLLLADNVYNLEGNGHYLIIYQDGNLLSLNQIINMRTTARNIFDYLKANSWYV